MTTTGRGVATITLDALGQLMQIRELSTVHVPDFDFSTVDRLLARFRLVLELAQTQDVGPVMFSAPVVILETEYAALVEIAHHAKLLALPAGYFDRQLYITTMRQLCVAVGRDVIEWAILW